MKTSMTCGFCNLSIGGAESAVVHGTEVLHEDCDKKREHRKTRMRKLFDLLKDGGSTSSIRIVPKGMSHN